MYYKDHNPPHFHAYYGEYEALIAVLDGTVLSGSLPRRALGHVQEWRQARIYRVGDGLAPCQGAGAVEVNRTAGVDMPRLIEASYVRDYVIRLRWNDGSEGEVDLSSELDGPIFEPLKNQSYFRAFTLSPELHTLVWPNGADMAPEFLREHSRVPA